MSLFGFLSDVVLAPVRVATTVADHSIRAVGKAVTPEADGVSDETKRAAAEIAALLEKLADEVDE